MIVTGDGFCHAKKGLLVLRECGKHALSACESCGSGLCEDHQILTGLGVFCADCAIQDDRFTGLQDERLERARARRDTGYYEMGIYHGFTVADYGAFDREASEGDESVLAEGAAAPGWEDESPSDSDDLDSSMES